jgi:Icc-related predicted phosphoesterase
MARAVTTVLAIGPVNDDVASLERVLAQPDAAADAIAVVGDLGAAWSKRESYRAIFTALGHTGLPTFWIPGAIDAPLSDHLREAYPMEIAFPHLRGVHGTFAYAPGQLVFAGMGGEILDDPEAIRDETELISYPGWETEYRLKVLRELKDYPLILMHTTPPAHKGLHTPGSHVLATLLNTYRPRVAIVARDEPSEMLLGKTLVVSPGRLDHGAYSVIDWQAHTVERHSLEGAEVERADPRWLPRRAKGQP